MDQKATKLRNGRKTSRRVTKLMQKRGRKEWAELNLFDTREKI